MQITTIYKKSQISRGELKEALIQEQKAPIHEVKMPIGNINFSTYFMFVFWLKRKRV